MPNLQTEAEINFYDGIQTTTTLEIGELGKIEDEYYQGIEKSKNLILRLSDLLKAFELEIRDNLLLLSEKEKISRLDSHLKEANKYLLLYKSHYEDYLKKEPTMYWIKPATHQKIIFIYKIIEIIEELRPKTNDRGGQPDINPLDLIDSALTERFKKIEQEVVNNKDKWPHSVVRLAAFCELLYEKKYFTIKPNANKSRPVEAINAFAKSRYGIDIGTALKGAKKKDREHHKSKKIKDQNSLSTYFR